jgi:hypothetical protein
MNISGIQNDLAKRSQDFTTLQSALQSGNLAGAQSAFAGFLQDVQKISQTAGPSSLFGSGTQASKDLQALGSALKSADLGGAKKAFASLEQDVQSATPSASSFTTLRAHHPVTHSEIASNGVVPFKASLQSIGNILNLKA